METKIACLDKGYVRLVTWLPWSMAGIRQELDAIDLEEAENDRLYEAMARLKELMGQDDLTTVNAARASFLKESGNLTEGDRRLIHFLAERAETSPFRHAILTFEVKAPLMTARQWFKYRVGSRHTPDSSELLGFRFGQGDDEGFDDPMQGRNEASRRYLTAKPDFYTPSEWRETPSNRKQGSGGPLPEREQQGWTEALTRYIEEGVHLYNGALERGMAVEQARLFLPAYGLYLVWRWTASLAAVCHFLNERLAEKAQREINDYAQAVWRLVRYAYPEAVEALVRQE